MPTNDPPEPPAARRFSPQRLAIPLVAVAAGVAYFVAGWLGDDLGFGIFGLVLMTGSGLAFLVAGRFSETVAGLLDRRDERINSIDMQATVTAGMAVALAVIIGFVVEIARGQDGSPYSMLGAIGGVTYVVAFIVLRFRR